MKAPRSSIRSTLRIGLVSVVAGTMLACTWVALSSGGEKVRLADLEAVASCEKLGKTRSTTAHEIALIPRSQGKVAEELATLARNEAAKMGGDTIVGVSEIREGSRRFAIYRCAGAPAGGE